MDMEVQTPAIRHRRWFQAPGDLARNGQRDVAGDGGHAPARLPADYPLGAADALSCGPLWISPNEMCEVRVAGHPVAMPLSHLRMLSCLLEARGRVISREELYRVSGADPLPKGSRRVDVHVARMRQSLGALGHFLVAVRRRGYRLDIAGLTRLG
jgi:DNA-binding response OmpR family regulator